MELTLGEVEDTTISRRYKTSDKNIRPSEAPGIGIRPGPRSTVKDMIGQNIRPSTDSRNRVPGSSFGVHYTVEKDYKEVYIGLTMYPSQ